MERDDAKKILRINMNWLLLNTRNLDAVREKISRALKYAAVFYDENDVLYLQSCKAFIASCACGARVVLWQRPRVPHVCSCGQELPLEAFHPVSQQASNRQHIE